jgi:hypothetical protein
MKLLFERIAVPMAGAGTRGAWYRGLRVMAIDGLVLDVPATDENDEEFGRSGSAEAPSPFPQVRLVALGECGTHAVTDAAFGPVGTGEQTLAGQLIARFVAACWYSPTGTCAPRGASSHPWFSREELEGHSWIRWLTRLRKKPGDGSMPVNRWPCPDGGNGASGDPHDMAKAELPESWSPVVSRSHPPESRLKPVPPPCTRMEVARCSLPEVDNVQ